MGPHKYFVQLTGYDKNKVIVQEVDPKVFAWLQQLPVMNTLINEPNLLKIERYEKLGLFQPTGEIQAFYAGVARMSDNTLIQQYHYFLGVKFTRLQGRKQKPFLIKDYSEILNQKTQNGDR